MAPSRSEQGKKQDLQAPEKKTGPTEYNLAHRYSVRSDSPMYSTGNGTNTVSVTISVYEAPTPRANQKYLAGAQQHKRPQLQRKRLEHAQAGMSSFTVAAASVNSLILSKLRYL